MPKRGVPTVQPKAKFQANVKAIRLLKELEAAGQIR